ncbi:MAG TPA: sigma factor-like helix-turn-helix DNA-binding protein, partial [Solirubrobacterales bacterium]|nr:sigma factor-like helix-turn-helix DNA-binding protein [Solirubrobacterales bacterium]
ASEPAEPRRSAVEEGPDPAALFERRAEHRERLRRFARLKPDERSALILFGLGYSYREIGARRGWTYTKVNRCISEGRAALRDAEGHG